MALQHLCFACILGKPFSDGEMIKDCIMAASDVICPQLKTDFAAISLSRQTITRRTEQISTDLQTQLRMKVDEFECCSIALDESTDNRDTAQLAIFIRGVDKSLQVTEELLALRSMKDTTTGADILKEVMVALEDFKIDLRKLTGVATDGAPAMIGKNIGFAGLFRKRFEDENLECPAMLHCIIHQENLAAKSLKMENVLATVKSAVNFIKSKGLKHRKFQEFLRSIESEYDDIPYYSEVRWLSRGEMMKRTYNISEDIYNFLKENGKAIEEFKNEEFMLDFAFCIDMLQQLNGLNTKLQGRSQLVTDLYRHVGGFEGRLSLWITQFQSRELDETVFTKLSNRMKKPDADLDFAYEKYADLLIALRSQFEDRFADFRSLSDALHLFSAPLSTAIETCPRNLMMELIDIKSDLRVKHLFQGDSDLVKSYQSLPPMSYPNLRQFASKYIAQFGSTYLCEQLFSRMKYIKNRYRTSLLDVHLSDLLRVSTSQFPPNYEGIADIIQHHPSH